MIKKTKIVATIGPASSGDDMLHSLITHGVNVMRLNTKHNEPGWHQEMIKRIRAISEGMHELVGILLDLQGPEIRVETFMGGDVKFQKDNLYILGATTPENENELYIPYEEVISSLMVGQTITVNDGSVQFKVQKVHNKKAELIAQNTYLCGNRKTINIPGLDVDIPSLTDRDKEFLEIIKGEPVDFVALSFIRTPDDVEILRKKLEEIGSDAKIVSKIETKLALENIEAIVDVSDCVMIARGDLGIEVPIEELAYWQKKMVRLCREHNKPVIVATQMLKSMVESPLPSRSEATDIANAVFNGTDAIMLSEETAIGNYPSKAVEAMAQIAQFNELKRDFIDDYKMINKNATEALVSAAAHMIEEGSKFDLAKVLVFTESGYTARALAGHRIAYEIIAVTDRRSVARQLTMVYGIQPFFTQLPGGPVHMENMPVEKLLTAKLLKKNDVILAVHGRKWKEPHASSVIGFFKV